MSTSAITSSTAATNFAALDRIPVQKLGQDDFIKILVTQLTTQDPLNPQKDTEFIAQMAQFSALESTQAMAAELQSLRGKQEFLQANSMLGQRVEVDLGDSNLVGTVSAVQVIDGEPRLIVENQPYSIADVVRVWQLGADPAFTAVPGPAPRHVE